VPLPRLTPLDRDAIADKQNIERPLIGLHGLHMRLVQLQPSISAEMSRARNLRPELRQMLVRLAPGPAFVFGFLRNICPLLRSERPPGLLRFGSDVWIVESLQRGQRREQQGGDESHEKVLR